MTAMHLIALVESLEHVCCRYRIAAFRQFLESAGHTLDIRPLPRHSLTRLHLFRALRGANVVLQRRLLPVWQISYLRSRVKRFLFDFDDAIFLRDSYSPRGLTDPRRQRRFAATVRAADAVLAGNRFLQAHAMEGTDPSRVLVVPTCVDPDRYPMAMSGQGRGETLRLVWVGSSSTLKGLDRCANLLDEIGLRVPGTRLKLICDGELRLPHLAVDHCAWSEATEAVDIAAADVGISWVPDDDWSRGKCGLKLLQYMAAGLPVIANPVGVHTEIVRHMETGFLAESREEWFAAASRLSADAGLRERMGRAGRRRLEACYSVAEGARTWLSVLESLQASPSQTA
jgi:glycosyltransferase involved in cell wall biosynthesis